MEFSAEWVMGRRNRYHGLLPLTEACRQAGSPQDELRIIHVAGTNGKGSTVNYLKDILVSQGFRTGTFTSPHLTDHRDRIRIDGKWIPENVFLRYLKEYSDIILKYDLGMFEIDLLIAVSWFRDEKTDFVILEAGIGGRLDNTNVFRKKELEIITTVSSDHTEVLGSRPEQIAFEKGGIIMPYSRCVCGKIGREAECVIRHLAYRRHAAFLPVPAYRNTGRGTFEFENISYEISGAEYQKANASLALYAARMLGTDISSGMVREAVRNSCWQGRFETVSHHPEIIIDGAHNEEGIRALTASLKGLDAPVIIVFSALKDKPVRRMAETLKDHCDLLILTTFRNPRAAAPEEYRIPGTQYIQNWKQAVRTAVKEAGESGTVVIAGSLYLISLARAWLNEEKNGIC